MTQLPRVRNRSTAHAIVRVANLVIVGLFAGFVLLILVYEYSLRSFGASIYAQAQKLEFVALPILAPSLLVPAVLTTGALILVTVRQRDRAFWLTCGGLVLLLITLAITLGVNVPLNNIEAGWNVQHPPSDWATVRDQWESSHAVRTATTLIAFVLLAAAAVPTRHLEPAG